jgi:hypothetical protein
MWAASFQEEISSMSEVSFEGRPAPPGYRWIFVTEFRHWRSGKIIRAADHGRKAFCLLVKVK